MSIFYIERTGKQVFQQPFAANNVQFYGFVVSADADSLQKNLCDKYLNNPSKGAVDFRPVGPFALIVFNKINSLNSINPPDSQKGWFSEQETAVWVLLEDRKREKLFWFHPYIFVDNSYAMAMGRELYGFPKSLGWFNIPNNPQEANSFSLETLVLKQFTPQTKGTRETLIDVKQTDPAGHSVEAVGLETIMKEMLHLFTHQNSIVKDLILAWNSASDVLHGRAPMVFLKQFPEVTNPNLACYQAILEVPSRMAKFHTGSLIHGKYEITIGDFQSHPIVQDLGLSSTKINPVLSYYVSFDFEIGNGTVIWQAQ